MNLYNCFMDWFSNKILLCCYIFFFLFSSFVFFYCSWNEGEFAEVCFVFF